MHPPTDNEVAPCRETFKYHNVHNIGSYLNDLSSKPVARVSPDTTLTALAQLGALRLNARRVLVSLFDRTHQFIIAEATRSLAVRSGRPNAQGDELWLSDVAIPRKHGICEHVLTLAPADTEYVAANHTAYRDTGGDDASVAVSSAALPISVVPDLSKDDRFSKRPFVVDVLQQHLFYAGVAIRTRRGKHLGVYCVLDDAPRPAGITAAEVEFLGDMSNAVMDHLETLRSHRQSRRTERMVRGLGSFVEGSSTLTGWWTNDNISSFQGTAGEEGLLDKAQQDRAQMVDPASRLDEGMAPSFATAVPSRPGGSPDNAGAAQTTRQNRNSIPTDQVKCSSCVPLERSSNQRSDFPIPDLHTYQMRRIFAKAANIIRESIEVEGVMFFDASISSFGGLVSGQKVDSSDSEDSTRLPTSSDKENPANDHAQAEHVCRVFAFSTSDGSSINDDNESSQSISLPESFLKVVLRRYPNGKVFNFDETGALQSSSESEEKDYRTTAKANNAVSHSAFRDASADVPAGPDPPHARKRKAKQYSRINEGRIINKVFPGARSVVLIPLWDQQRQRWFAGAVAWTRQLSRPFSVRGELSYLSAFGVSVMAQIARLDALMADKAKADVLGSVSHELRSPLHGVLGGVEMLLGTSIDAFQGDIVRTIETCSRTLLDTINHLLDYSKINNFMQAAHSKGRSARSALQTRGNSKAGASRETIESGMMSISDNIEIDALAEETIESVYAGHCFLNQSSPLGEEPANDIRKKDLSNSLPHESQGSQGSSGTIAGQVQGGSGGLSESFSGASSSPSGVAIVLDFRSMSPNRTADWSFHTQPGALRRIFLNLFGNALKYTTRGLIRVSLSSRPLGSQTHPRIQSSGNSDGDSPNDAARRSEVVFTVTDTGKGISQDYLHSNLFTPFSQEDRLAPGNGLGLSLVRHIVHGLNGHIDIRSDLGVGTEVTVRLPLTHSEPVASGGRSVTTAEQEEFEKQVETLRGTRIALVGFAHDDDVVKVDVEILRNSNKEHLDSRRSWGWQLPRRPVEDICRDRLGMQVLPNEDHRLSVDDVCGNCAAPSKAADPHVSATIVSVEGMVPPSTCQNPDIILATEAGAEQLAENWTPILSSDTGGSIRSKQSPVLVVCRDMAVANARSRALSNKNLPFEWISQPCGPRKLARAFSLLLTGKPDPEDSKSQTFNAPDLQDMSLSRASLPERTRKIDTALTEVEDDKGRNKFLLVEDNRINLKILVAYMKKNGYAYDTAGDGLEALKKFKKDHAKYRCILMDISMPVMDGLECSRSIRNFEHDKHLTPTTIIALTGLASESAQQEAFASGIDLFLTKPVRLKELGSVLIQRE